MVIRDCDISRISIHAPAKGATDCAVSVMMERSFISIHAPAKGATGYVYQSGGNDAISIHAPAKGATLELDKLKSYSRISIHAPAKGATAFINIFSLAVRLFFISSHQ